ncbi:MAG: hypothetical protein M0Z54_06205 [Thermaerobacter sp.]|nr:hypothetical protein [Thermaerobacter sp.]
MAGGLGHRMTVVGLVAGIALVGAAALYVLDSAASHLSGNSVHPAPVFSSSGYSQQVTASTAAEVLLHFVPDQDANNLGTAMCTATGQPTCRLAHFPGQVHVSRSSENRFLVSVVMTVQVHRLLKAGEISLGSLPGASSLTSGQLAVSSNSAIYGVKMNPSSHRAVFSFLLAANGSTVWATDWNALGAVSQSASLQ